MKISVLKRGKSIKNHSFEIKFPGEVDVMPPVGTRVRPETVIASGNVHKIKEVISLTDIFGKITKKDIDDGLVCYEGEVVVQGSLLFSKRKLGFDKKEIRASEEGLVSLQEIERGKILILDTKEKLTLKAGLNGVIEGIYPEGIIQITADAYALEMFRVFGPKVGGSTVLLSQEDFEIKNRELSPKKEVNNCVVILDFPLNKEIYKSVLIAGGVGIIAPSAESELFKQISLYKRITVGLIEGWGALQPPQIISEHLNALAGLYGELESGGTKTYFGRLITPHVTSSKLEEFLPRVNVKMADKVQIFEPPYWAKEGSVEEILDENILSVKLKSGETIIVPASSVSMPIL